MSLGEERSTSHFFWSDNEEGAQSFTNFKGSALLIF